MNAPAVVAVILLAVALVAVGFVVTLLVASGQRRTWTSDDDNAGVWRDVEVGT